MRHSILTTGLVLLSLVLAAPAAKAADVYLADGSGTLTIDTDGRVLELNIDQRFGAEIDAALRQTIAGWAFEPVTEDGRPVQAQAHMVLQLKAVRSDGDKGLRVGIDRVQFVDPPAERSGVAPGQVSRKPPHYPSRQLREGYGANIEMLVELATDGSVVRSAPVRAVVFGAAQSAGAHARTVKGFVTATTRAMTDWRFGAVETGGSRFVTVPVSYRMRKESPWNRAHWVELAPVAWADEAEADKLAALTESGQPVRTDIRLLSPLDGDDSASG